ncbi:MAG: OsmC family protein [Actinobacteria bacterium]|nr:OsmC family protein [Actinomycetota bacterium]
MTVTDHTRNGVDVDMLFATIDAVKSNPQIADFRFRVTNHWIAGTNSRTTIHDFHGALQDLTHVEPRTYEADHPVVLTGKDRGSTPAEFLLHALAACLTAGIANIAAARGVRLDEVSSTVEGDIDLRGLLGLDPGVRNGFEGIRVSFRLRGDDPAALRQVFEQSKARSAVLDMVTNGVPVSFEVDAA